MIIAVIFAQNESFRLDLIIVDSAKATRLLRSVENGASKHKITAHLTKCIKC